MNRKSNAGKRTDVRVRAEILQFLSAHRDASAADVKRHLESAFTAERRRALNITLPTLRTVQNLVREMRSEDQSGEWSVADARPDEAAAVLPVLAWWNQYSEGRVQTLTKSQARWVHHLRLIQPEVPHFAALMLADIYRSREAKNEPTHDLDMLLAYRVWQSKERLELYFEAQLDGWLPGWDPGALVAVLFSAPAVLEDLPDAEDFGVSHEQRRVRRRAERLARAAASRDDTQQSLSQAGMAEVQQAATAEVHHAEAGRE